MIWFNKIYEEHRVEDVYDTGYDKWINDNKFSSDKIEGSSLPIILKVLSIAI